MYRMLFIAKILICPKACFYLLTDPIREATLTGAGNDLANVSRSN